MGFVVLILDILVWSMWSPLLPPFQILTPPCNPIPFIISCEGKSGGGIYCFVLFCIDINVREKTVEVLKSNRPPSHKLLWCVVVFIFPIVGLVVYWLFSNRAAHGGGGEYEALP